MDLFNRPGRAGRQEEVLTVTRLTQRVKDALERQLGTLWVEGEISNFRRQNSGHCYFTLKDAGAQLSCVLFRGDAAFASAPLADGLHVQVFGSISVYEARGQYQMIVRRVRQGGLGALQVKFEALKRRLAEEGLFDQARKRPIVRFPRTIAIITSPTGAAVRDMLNILARRAPWVRVLIWPVRVQGAGAGDEIAAGLKALASPEALGLPPLDTIVLARGGGSLEDLWAFNEEALARAIVASPVPVVSAVGHEIDFTISDFAADLRAPTPSAAAELIVPDRADLLTSLLTNARRLRRSASQMLSRQARVIELTARALRRDPERLLLPWQQRLDMAEEALHGGMRDSLTHSVDRLRDLSRRLDSRRPDLILSEHTARLRLTKERISSRTRTLLDQTAARLESRRSLLRSLGPDSVLARGFSWTMRSDGSPVTDASQLRPGDEFRTRLARGEVRGVVKETQAAEERDQTSS